MKKIKTFLMSLGVLLLAFGAFGQLAYAADSALDCGTRGGTWNSKDSTCSQPESAVKPNDSIQQLIAKIINILSWVVGVISVIMIIVAGFKYVTSGGNEKGVSGAKSTILYAIVGLVIVALAQVIVRFVLTNVGS